LARITDRRIRQRALLFRMIRVRSPKLPCAASASAPAAKALRARCARATWRHSKRNTAREGGPPAVGDASGEVVQDGWKSEQVKQAMDCACHASLQIGVPTNVDLQRTGPSSCRTITRRTRARCTLTRSHDRPVGTPGFGRAGLANFANNAPGFVRSSVPLCIWLRSGRSLALPRIRSGSGLDAGVFRCHPAEEPASEAGK